MGAGRFLARSGLSSHSEGERIRRRRRNLRWEQDELASMVGLSQDDLARIEAGLQPPPPELLHELGLTVEPTARELAELSEPPPRAQDVVLIVDDGRFWLERTEAGDLVTPRFDFDDIPLQQKITDHTGLRPLRLTSLLPCRSTLDGGTIHFFYVRAIAQPATPTDGMQRVVLDDLQLGDATILAGNELIDELFTQDAILRYLSTPH
jgi:transcriptional regulator with XRE-family HTH domain